MPDASFKPRDRVWFARVPWQEQGRKRPPPPVDIPAVVVGHAPDGRVIVRVLPGSHLPPMRSRLVRVLTRSLRPRDQCALIDEVLVCEHAD